jgi:ATP-dependent Clp protease ATP-binding subunit ClpA
MFERFTKDARTVVSGATQQAAHAGADQVDAGHMLLALLDQRTGRGAGALKTLGAPRRRASIEAALAEARGRGGLTDAEAEALAGLGIDLAEIVSRVEAAHGPGALAGSAARRGRREKGHPLRHLPLGPDAKAVLVGALRIATGRRDRYIGDEHLLLALLSRPGIPADVLSRYGVTHAAVQRVLDGGDGEAAAD